MTDRSTLHDLARLAGVERRYLRQDGAPVEVPDDALRAVLRGLGFDASSAAAAREAALALEQRAEAPLAPLIVVEAGAPARTPVRHAASAFEWRLTLEDGAQREGRSEIGSARSAVLPADLPAGYHTLEALGCEATLIVAPPRCWRPARFDGGERGWGVTAQVYGLSSPRDFGVGGFGEIADLARGAGELGASFLGLSPLHAMFNSDRGKHSPYSPSNRMLLEPLFIDPLQAPGADDAAVRQLLEETGFAQRVAAARAGRIVDYHESWALKRVVLDAAWRAFRARGDHAAFEAFRKQGGAALETHALFEALSERFQAQGMHWVGEWPEPFRNHVSPQTRAAAAEESERVAFHAWLQWVADMQLAAAAQAARDAGMDVGLYRDLAVGSDRGGSEVWCEPEAYADGLSVGAPPDPLGPEGQNWGLPAMHPLRLERTGLSAFRRLVSSNMRHAGAIRIDHAFQLERLFLIPDGATAHEGAYVNYPFAALLAALRIESHRAQSLVIAEDLGTSPEGFSEAIMESGVLSYRLLFFERTADGGFAAPADYPRDALAAISTHDLPTLAGWWRGVDIDTRACFGALDAQESAAQQSERRGERRKLAQALQGEGLAAGSDVEDAPVIPVIRYLARTPSMLLALQAEDLARDPHQANVPGPARGYPNWRRRLPLDVAALTAAGSLTARAAVAMREEGRGAPQASPRLDAPPPRATYRLQLHAGFTFADAAKIAPYLAELGVSHVYASPIQTARPGSTHGYDIVDHDSVNPELGGEEGFRVFSQALRENGLKLLLDIVPNHMGVGGADNAWWLSTLEWGELSPHAAAFDIDWERLGANRRLVLPFLGKPYGQALREGELQLKFDAREGAFSVWHWEHRFPINPLDYRFLIEWAQVAGGAGAEMRPLLAISEELRELVDAPRPASREGRVERCEQLKRALARATARSPRIRAAIDAAVAFANGDVSAPESFGPLHRLLDRQSYRLASWRVATAEVNYRRFFDINALAGVRVEDEAVFEATHRLIFRLVAEGHVHGLRIDHVDGLADPQGYLQRLQQRVGPGFYVVVEKILEPGETLRPWPIAGTTGYEALNQLDGLFIASQNEERFDAIYR
ncbi:MAG TPA: 4-alpha-glucanotransferase, partial [Beijerinckiaceae bacterium]